jgi:hypothetical protein
VPEADRDAGDGVSRLRLLLFVFIGAVCWLILIAAVALIVSFMGWPNFLLGVGAFVTFAVVIGSILLQGAEPDPLDAPESNLYVFPGIHDWERDGVL